MLSPYDEFPVHQTTRPLSMVVDTNTGFDDGYYFGAFSAEEQTFCFQGLRISPNTDLIGGYVGLLRDGRQRTLRFGRTWRERCATEVGPYRLTAVEPYRHIRLELAPNESGTSDTTASCSMASSVRNTRYTLAPSRRTVGSGPAPARPSCSSTVRTLRSGFPEHGRRSLPFRSVEV